MPPSTHVSNTGDEVVAEIASIRPKATCATARVEKSRPHPRMNARKSNILKCLQRIDLIVRATEAFMNERVNAPRRRGEWNVGHRASP